MTPYRATASSPIEYSVGWLQEPTPFAQTPHWDDCLGPSTLWLLLERAVERWNTRR